MKRITTCFKILAVMILFLGARVAHSQCVGSFSYTIGSGGVVTFTNTSSTGSTTPFSWSFGNGTYTYNVMSPTVTYTANGSYAVMLAWAATGCGTVITTQTITITNAVTPTCNLVANFSATLGSNGLVGFGNTSTGVSGGATYSWTFGDGSTSASANPLHTYTANGAYTVTLQVNNNVTPTCASTATMTVNITNACNLAASYTYSVAPNGVVYFFNTSSGTGTSTAYYWNFGNGTTTTNISSPAVTYSANGSYPVTLILSAPGCGTAQVTHTVTVNTNTTNPCTLNASFTYTLGSNGLVNFFNTSTGTSSATSYSWNFGDGGTSSSSSPVHTYSANGTYTVVVSVNNGGGCTSGYGAVIVISNVCSITANFTSTAGANGLVTFNNTSTGASYYSWYFGDGSSASSSTSPAHTYTANGYYVVTLIAVGSNTACSATHTAGINVYNAGCNINANFSYSVANNGIVYFFDTSTGTTGSTTYAWIFGNGGPVGHGPSVSHSYANGTYTVTHFVSDTLNFCNDSITQVITVNSTTCVANASFSLMPSGTPHLYYAIPSSSAGVASAVWHWGDGSSSTGLYTSHTYSAAGLYNMCLTMYMSCGDSATTCIMDSLSRGAGNMSMIQVNVVTPQQVAMGIKNINNASLSYVVSPNPGNGNFNVSMNGLTTTKATISIYNLVGSLVFEAESDVANGSLTKDIRLNDVPAGVYFIKVNDDQKAYTKKLIINK